jgi:6-pyruvoyltetrahydropterin/6-carboxytetrahydropterin synthase
VLIRKSFRFEAAHVLPFHPGKCSRLHGHSYKLDVAIAGPILADGPAQGMVLDFGDLSEIVKREVLALCDHTSLNDLLDNPTAERIVVWIWKRLAPWLPLAELTLWETQTACAVLRADDPLTA